MGQQKSLFITYFLWFFFGWFGLHHVYLGRDRQAFIWWSTFGGIFFMGWFRDLWRIPEYVDEANQEDYYMETLNRKVKLRVTPQFNTARFAGEMAVGYFYGVLIRMAIPEELPNFFQIVLVPIGISVGVHLVGNIGREKGPFVPTYITTLATWCFLQKIGGPEVSYMYCALAASCMFNYYRHYDSTYQKKSICNRLSTFCKCATIIWLLWISFFYFNATVTLQNKEKIRLRDSINHFFKSPAWLDFKKTIWRLYEEGQKKGWKNIYDQFVLSIDPTGESNAYKVLGVYKSSSEEDIRKAYKKLVVKWHPDRYKGPDKESAEVRFIEIQQAYEILTKRRKNSFYTRGDTKTEF